MAAVIGTNPFSSGQGNDPFGNSQPIPGAVQSAGVMAAAGTGSVPATGSAAPAVGAPVPAAGAPGMAMMGLFGEYQPSFLIALIGAIFFTITFFLHSIQLIRTKAWYFSIIPQAALLAAVSASARAFVTLRPRLMNAFLAFTFTQKALTPVTMIGTIFTFTRIVWWITPNEKRTFNAVWSPPGFISVTWVAMTAICDIMKIVGSTVLTMQMQTPQGNFPVPTATGRNLEGSGIVLQFFVFGGFTAMAARFHWLAGKWEAQGDMVGRPAHWRQLSWAVIACASLSTVRQIDQIVVFDQERVPLSYTLTQEWVFWFFDQLPLLLVYFIYINIHPGDYFPRDYTGLRLNRKKLLVIKGESETRTKNGFVISSPRPTGPDRSKPDWVQVKEIEVGPYGIAK